MFSPPLPNSGGDSNASRGHIGRLRAMAGQTLSSHFTTAKKSDPRYFHASQDMRASAPAICNSCRPSPPNPAVERTRQHVASTWRMWARHAAHLVR